MKLRINRCEMPWNEGKWKIEKYSWLWGWEDWGSVIFDSYESASIYLRDYKIFNG